MIIVDVSYIVNAPFEVEDSDILSYVNSHIKTDEPTDLDSEAEDESVKFIDENDSDGMICFDELKEAMGFKELKAQIKKYIYLKRHEPNTFKKLYEETNELA